MGVVALLLVGCGDPSRPESDLGATTFDYRNLPRQISQLDLGFSFVDAFCVSGPLAAVSRYRDLVVIDIADRTHPRVIGESYRDERIEAMALLDSVLVVLDDSVRVIDARAPDSQSRAVIGLAPDEVPYFARTLAGVCWLGIRRPATNVLARLDLEDPDAAHIAAEVEVAAQIVDIAIDNSLCLVGTSNGTVFLDISDLDNMQKVVTVGNSGSAAIANGFAYVGGSSFSGRGVTVLDVRDPQHPVEVGSTLSPWPDQMRLVGRYLFVRSSSAVDVIDMIDRRRPVIVGSFAPEAEGRINAFEVQSGRLWTVGSRFREFEFTDSFSSPLLGEKGVRGYWNWFAQLEQGRIYYQSGRELHSLSLADPSFPESERIELQLSAEEQVRAVHANEVLTSTSAGITVRDLMAGRVRMTVDIDDPIEWVHVDDDELLVITADEIRSSYQLHVYGIGNGPTAILRHSLRREGNPYARFGKAIVEDGRLYVMVSEDGYRERTIDIIEMRSTWQPTLVAQLPLPEESGEYTAGMALTRDHLVVEGIDLTVVDVRDPTSPRVVAQRPGNSSQYVAVRGNTLYSSNPRRMVLFDLTRPDRPHQIAEQGWTSGNNCQGLFATPQRLIALMDNGIYAYPLHGS
jgi:hypothetical protein